MGALKRILLVVLVCVSAVLHMSAGGWQPDVLGGGYEMRSVGHGSDYSGKVVSTIIR